MQSFLVALQADFSAAFSGTFNSLIRWPNADFRPPNPANGVKFATFDIEMGDATQVECGGTGQNRFRYTGAIVVSVYAPPNMGDAGELANADAIADRYRSTILAGAQFRTPSIVVGGLQGGWWTTRIRCPFFADRVA